MQVPLVALVAVGVLNVAFAVFDTQPLSALVRVFQLLLFLALFGATVRARRQWVDHTGGES